MCPEWTEQLLFYTGPTGPGLEMIHLRSYEADQSRNTTKEGERYHAWMTPGIQPRIQRAMFIQTSDPTSESGAAQSGFG